MKEANIKVIGVGGAGCNVVNFFAEENEYEVELVGVNTDAQALEGMSSDVKQCLLGAAANRGLSMGGDSGLGRKIAEKDKELLVEQVKESELVFIVTGLGGGTGSGVAPYLADLARKQGATVITYAMLPFTIEGGHRHQVAEYALGELRLSSNALIPLPNDLLLQQLDQDETVLGAFKEASKWITRGVTSMLDIFYKPGIINLDYMAVKNAFSDVGGKTLYGLAEGKGSNYVQEALDNLLMSPLLHLPQISQRADVLLVNIVGGRDLSLKDVNHIGTYVSQRFGSKEKTLIGAAIDDEKEEEVEICVIGVAEAQGASKGVVRKSRVSRSKENPRQQVLFDEAAVSVKREGLKLPLLKKKKEYEAEEEDRGYFVKTDKNLFHGEDLDIPTYLRRGIKVRL